MGVLVEKELSVPQQCALTAQKAKCILGFITSSVARRSKEVILSLYSTVRPLLEYCFQLWDLLERVQRRDT